MEIITKRNFEQDPFWGKTVEIAFNDFHELHAEELVFNDFHELHAKELALIVHSLCSVQHTVERVTFTNGHYDDVVTILREVYCKGYRDLPHLKQVIIKECYGYTSWVEKFPAIPSIELINFQGSEIDARKVLYLQTRLNAAKSMNAEPVRILPDAAALKE